MITCSATFALAAALLAAQPATQPTTPAPAAPGAPATTPAPPATPTSPQQIIRDLEKQAGQPGGAPTQPGTPAAQPASAQPPAPAAPGTVTSPAAGGRLLREGSFLTNRKGRLVRGALQAGGSHPEWFFVFDNTAGEPAAKADPAMVLMPCQNLMSMEKLVERGGESLSFTVSGQVFVYHGRNHLLPTMFTVNRRGELSPAK
ncbi:MAG: hypothetical protein ACK51N_03365 [bacterium]|jgi:hypothetical protein|nr:hypothetical protein [Phycisphaerales bacterium]MCE2654301.1 hypothetical protein [Planctomycetaceae bacterium]